MTDAEKLKIIQDARQIIRRKLRASSWQWIKNALILAGVALLAVGAITLIATLWAAIAVIMLALFVAGFILAFARILIIPAVVAMLIAATLYILGVVP